MKIRVFDLVGANCLALEDGDVIYREIVSALHRGELVELDFQNIQFFASPFFNAAIGRLLKDFAPDDLNKLVQFVNLHRLGTGILRKVVENAKRYYANPDAWKGVTDVTEEWSDED